MANSLGKVGCEECVSNLHLAMDRLKLLQTQAIDDYSKKGNLFRWLGILIGIAIDKGYIKNADENILNFFPDYKVQDNEKTIQNIKLKDIMSLTVPYKFKEEPYVEYFTSDNHLKFCLDLLGGNENIGHIRYAPVIGPDILSGEYQILLINLY